MKIFPINNSVQTRCCARTFRRRTDVNFTEKPDVFEKKNVYDNAVSFQGLNAKGVVRQRGLLFHITSLPAHRSYCGQFGDEQTTKFIKWLNDAKQTHWIMSPLNALEDNLCPYSSVGRFSRNKFIVNLNKLTGKEYGKILKPKELPDDITVPEFTFEMLEKQKSPRFELAFSRFQKLPETASIKKEYNKFLKENDDLWLDDYANYDVLSKKFGSYWLNWDKSLQTAPEDARKEGITLQDKILNVLEGKISREEYQNKVDLYKFEQFLYDKQYNELTKELDKKGIRILQDLPIGVSYGGVDVWGKKNIFLLGNDFKPSKVSGCPPEKAYPYTQCWGQALYDYDSPDFWKYQEASIRQLLKNTDLRLDHFVGYINRAEIPSTLKTTDGRTLQFYEIFRPIEEGGLGTNYFDNNWVKKKKKKKSPKGENIVELFVRVAKELGKKPEETYILEDFGPLGKTKLYKEFHKKFGKNFTSQQIPIGMDICDPKNRKKMLQSNVAILTGNHDLPPLREFVDKLTDNTKLSRRDKTAQKKFAKFCQEELKLTPEEMQDKNAIYENLLKWHYTMDVKQVQTTLQDALGIYFRPNIPGFWNGMYDKFLMKTTPEALLPYWSRVFPKDFLSRDNQGGINPGYKKLADKFTQMMKELYPKEK